MTDTTIGAAAPAPLQSLRWSIARAFWRLRHWLHLEPECNSVRHARRELALLRDPEEPCEMQDAIERDILKIVRTFSRQGHSGFSASYALGVLEKLLRFEPITPLTGADEEWVDVSAYGNEPCWQNRRCSRVFKGADGRAYDIEGRVFTDPQGCSYTCRDSRVYVTFPYAPKTEFVRVDEDGKPIEEPSR